MGGIGGWLSEESWVWWSGLVAGFLWVDRTVVFCFCFGWLASWALG
jgi:hypothetical protein